MPSTINFYPNDPYINYTYEPAGKGGLTNVRNNIIFYIIIVWFWDETIKQCELIMDKF